MSQWSEITKVALLGTQRAALPKLAADTAAKELLASLDDEKPEQKLLKIAGMLGLYEQVGQVPQQIVHNPKLWMAAPPDERKSCSPALAERLSLMIDGRFRDLLPECFTALAEANQRLPNMLLPDFLERGKNTPLLRPFLLPVLGRRGRWLAAQNPAWTYASPSIKSWGNLTKLWRTDNRTARHSLLRQLRHTYPQLARQLLESAWKSESPATRSTFIRLMEFGLSMDDEPFLEAALDDRDFQVRRKAAELLTYLPESRLCQRMKGNTQFILRWAPGQKHQIVVTFPTQISDQLLRDGVTRDVGKNAARGRSRQLIQMISAIPLDWWTERWQTTPEEIVLAVQTSLWPRTLTQGLTNAAQRQKNVAWAMTLLNHANFLNAAVKLIPILPIEKCKLVVERLTNEMDDGPPFLKDSSLLRVFRYWSHPWDEELAHIWIDHLAKQVQLDTEDKPGPFLRTAVKNFARACPPQLADQVVQTFMPLTKARPGWRLTLTDLKVVLTFRQAMYAEIE